MGDLKPYWGEWIAVRAGEIIASGSSPKRRGGVAVFAGAEPDATGSMRTGFTWITRD